MALLVTSTHRAESRQEGASLFLLVGVLQAILRVIADSAGHWELLFVERARLVASLGQARREEVDLAPNDLCSVLRASRSRKSKRNREIRERVSQYTWIAMATGEKRQECDAGWLHGSQCMVSKQLSKPLV